MIKNNEGITLVALVITIIVLLILAGVSIAMLTGDNGILTKATDAENGNERANAAEIINSALSSVKIDATTDATATIAKLTERLKSDIGDLNCANVLTAGKYTITTATPSAGVTELVVTYKPTDGSENIVGKIIAEGTGKGNITLAVR